MDAINAEDTQALDPADLVMPKFPQEPQALYRTAIVVQEPVKALVSVTTSAEVVAKARQDRQEKVEELCAQFGFWPPMAHTGRFFDAILQPTLPVVLKVGEEKTVQWYRQLPLDMGCVLNWAEDKVGKERRYGAMDLAVDIAASLKDVLTADYIDLLGTEEGTRRFFMKNSFWMAKLVSVYNVCNKLAGACNQHYDVTQDHALPPFIRHTTALACMRN